MARLTRYIFALSIIATCPGPTPARAELTNRQVLVIANSRNSDSVRLARYYADKRNIPASRICLVDVPTSSRISRYTFEKNIRTPLRQLLAATDPDRNIHAMVVMYGMPLGVAAPERSPMHKEKAQQLQKQYNQLRDDVLTIVSDINNLGSHTGSGDVSDTPPPTDFRDIVREVNKAYATAGQRIAAISDRFERDIATRRFLTFRQRLEGVHKVFHDVADMLDPNSDFYKAMLTRTRQLDDRLQANKQLATRPAGHNERTHWYNLNKEYGGLLGAMNVVQVDINELQGRNATAALDSELALLYWDGYPTTGMLDSTLYHAYDHTRPQLYSDGTMLMVTRLDAPTPDIVTRMIDDSIAAERVGMQGTCYLDARNITKQNGYLAYDRSLHELADFIRTQTDMPVVLDNNSSLFEPGSCPDAALYCGWYSLKKYVPSCTFVPGAVAYHISSLEAQNFHQPDSSTWCPNLLKDNASATLGAVDEPYLHTFPLPMEFFSLLLTGKYTIAEVFYLTSSHTSWQVTLFADPLYNPFAANPQVDVADLPPELADNLPHAMAAPPDVE